MDTVEERVLNLEKLCGCTVPGTELSRVLVEGKLGWTLSLGTMRMPKQFFTDITIEGVLEQAETHFRYVK